MASLSTVYKNALCNYLLGSGTAPLYANLYVAAFTTIPTADTQGTEPVGNGYARVALNNGSGQPTWTPSTAVIGEKSLTAEAAFPEATPAGWGTIVGIGIFSAATGGVYLMYDQISSEIVNANGILRIPAGTSGLKISFS